MSSSREEQEALLNHVASEGDNLVGRGSQKANGGRNGYKNSYGAFEVKSGYSVSPSGLANMVAHGQIGFLDTFGGANELGKAIGCLDVSNGLGDRFDYENQKKLYGSNALELPPKPSLIALILEGLQEVTVIMLICSAIVSLFLGLVVEKDYTHGWIEGVSILCSVTVVISVAALTDYSKALEFRNQQMELDNEKKIQVIRNGASRTIHPSDLVVGDIVRVAVGDIIPADGVLVEGSDLKFDESALTGETDLVEKGCYDPSSSSSSSSTSCTPFIVSGTNVMHGSGKMLVVAVGKYSMQGKILERIREQDGGGEENELLSHGNETTTNGSETNLTSHNSDDKSDWCSFLKNLFTFGAADGGDLMEKLDILAVDIGKLGMIVAVFVFVVMISRWFVQEWVHGGGCLELSSEASCNSLKQCKWDGSSSGTCGRTWQAADLSTILQCFITAITILVVAVPEGLPLAVTLSLAVSMRRMTSDANQVKHLDSTETMGSATTICSDKTGTLTENKMTVMRVHIAGADFIHRAGDKLANIGQVIEKEGDLGKTGMRLLCEGIILDSMPTSRVSLDMGKWTYEGNATECALLKMAEQLGYDAEPLRKSYKESGSTSDWGVYTIPFSSERKKMSWVIRSKGMIDKGSQKKNNKQGAMFRLYTKGAPLQVIDSSSSILAGCTKKDGPTIRPLTDQDRENLYQIVEKYQKLGMRTLALGYREFDKEPKGGWESSQKSIESDITLISLFAIEDPLRPSVPKAINQCRQAGIDIRMCTGDALRTAVAIATQCGILRPTDFDKDGEPKQNFAMTGAEFDDRVHKKALNEPKVVRRTFDPETGDSIEDLAPPFQVDEKGNKILDQKQFDEIWPTLRVLARCQPEDKLTLVRGMRKSKLFLDDKRCAALSRDHNIDIFPDYQVVAVTGDGTNDAPALKSADVGFAMGIVGTETAKQACDIILLDDNFSSIVKAVMWGRNVFDCISKFIVFQLTVNVVAITIAVIGAFVFNESPLSATQMLWLNMIMDSLASLALATELPTEDLLDRPPYGKRRKIISANMFLNIFGHSLYQIAVCLIILFDPESIPCEPRLTNESKSASMHWSFFFNAFVQMQLFNQLNARCLRTADKLRSSWSEWNIFKGVFSNPMFSGVLISEFVLQIIIVQYGGLSLNLVSGGLSWNQWEWCLIFGFLGIVWQLVLNVIMVLAHRSGLRPRVQIPYRKSSSGDLEESLSEAEQQQQQQRHHHHHRRRSPAKVSFENWRKVRHNVRYGRVYARAFGLSLGTGIKLNQYITTRRASMQREESYTAIARQLSVEFHGAIA